MNADGGALQVEAVGGNVGVSDAGQVWRDHGETLGQSGDDGPPHQRRLCVAVKQYERRAVAGCQVMQFHAVDLGRARGDNFV